MFNSEKVRLLLLEEFAKAQSRNPRYSMRSFARKIGISQSAVSEFLSGKRTITSKSAVRILHGLDRDPEEILELMPKSGDRPTGPPFHPIALDTFRLISDWHYYAILSLAETDGFNSSPDWIAKRLGIPVDQAVQAIARLLKLGLLVKDPQSARLTATGRQVEAISQIANSALRKANRQNLELAIQALEEVPFEQRDFSGITLCLDPSRMEEARALIRGFRREFSRAMESGAKKEVYKLCVQLIPLSKSEEA